ncbi:amino acid transporter [Pseudomassariella vexata]|uniref:Amino acid transporter n=1 Tax=Pseudomassariella vexata TaxID=1141098 RepID=A0A1Y2E1Z9_9PEZI|nr:amino acid transporter [Pseudomassariella vexata]ORY65552.1 amino acid transporter [Pseudomassariella vexata]
MEPEKTASGMKDLEGAGYHRRLTKRQIMMMTFGAGIGTGLWVGTGQALRYAGPGGIAVAYSVVAYIVWTLYMSIGEMTTYRPVHGGFIRQAAEYIDPALGFAEGINFWFAWVMIIPAEITAAIDVLKFWPASQNVPLAAYITLFLVVTAIPNIFPVKWYGHVEYGMSWAKLVAIFVMIFYLFIMASGGVPATGGPLVFTYWKNPGAFNNGMKGLAKAFVQAAFSFGGAQHIAIIAGEAINPRQTIKSTVYPIFWRMFLFFVLNIWLVGMCVPYNDEDLINGAGTLASPFVIALKRGNQMWLAHTINGFIFLTVVSCGVTSVYISSRSLTALSDIKLIHPIFGKKDSRGRPWLSLTVCTLLGGGLCYLNLNSTGQQVYGWFSSLVSIATFMGWLTMLATHIAFRRALKAQGISRKSLPLQAPGAPYSQWFAIVLVAFCMGCEFYLALYPFGEEPSAKGFFSVYLAFPLFIFDYFVYKWWCKTKLVNPAEVDLSEAKVFDEEDRVSAEIAAQDGTLKQKKFDPVRSLKNLVFG